MNSRDLRYCGNPIHLSNFSESTESMFRKHDFISKKVSEPHLTMISSYIVPVMSNRCGYAIPGMYSIVF